MLDLPCASHRHPDPDNTGAGASPAEQRARTYRANQLRAVSLHRSSDEQPAKIGHRSAPAPALPVENPRRSSRRRHRNRPSDNAAFQLDPARINDLLSYLKSSNKFVAAASRRPLQGLHRPAIISSQAAEASLNAATAAAARPCRILARLEQARRDHFPLLSTILAIIRSSAVGSNPPRSGIAWYRSEAGSRLSAIGAQRCRGQYHNSQSLDQPGLQSASEWASARETRESGTSFAGEIAFAASRALRPRRPRNPQLSLMVLLAGPDFAAPANSK